ncbi:MAG: hypothetical protein ACE5LS_04690 [Thermoplasmata archaeon]
MRLAALFVTILLTSPIAASFLAGASAGPPSSDPQARDDRKERELTTAEPEDFRLDPGAQEWVSFAPQRILIQVGNPAFELRPNASLLLLDEVPLDVTWHAATGSIWSSPLPTLEDGLHAVKAILVPVEGEVVTLEWAFGLDTQVPELEIEALPDVTANRTLNIQGTVKEPRLVGLRVRGTEVPVENGTFSMEVSLWPGVNDLTVEAEDAAGNLGRFRHATQLTLDPPYETFKTWVHPNSSFALDLPESWLVRQNVVVGSGSRADIVSIGPLTPGLQTSLIVTSRRSLLAYPRGTALEWMDLLLSSVEAGGQLALVVSEPRILDSVAGTTSVQASYLHRFTADLVAFNQVTMVWSQSLGRQWVLIASLDTRNVEEGWPSLGVSMASFRVLEDAPSTGIEEQESRLVFSTVVVVTAAVVLVGVLSVVLLERPLARWRDRKAQRWRPPRKWRL